jgi:hypothetical protein
VSRRTRGNEGNELRPATGAALVSGCPHAHTGACRSHQGARAVAFLQELVQRAFTKLHTGDTICEEGIFASFPHAHIADSTGFRLPESLAKEFPGATPTCASAGSGSKLPSRGDGSCLPRYT